MRERILERLTANGNGKPPEHAKNLADLSGLIVAAMLDSNSEKALLLAKQLERHLIEDAANG